MKMLNAKEMARVAYDALDEKLGKDNRSWTSRAFTSNASRETGIRHGY